MLPIVQRELLIASRKRATVWLRVASASIGFFLVLLTVGVAPVTAGPSAGALLFHALSFVAFWTCLFGGALLTADCLSVERREGTLGLLFLTDLKGYDVVLGKLMAGSVAAIFCLLAVLPMLAIPLLIGGVTAGEFWRMVAVLVSTLFFSLSVGMAASVFCRDARNAFAVAVFIIFLFTCAAALPGASFRWHPLLALSLVPAGRYAAEPETFVLAIVLTHLLAWSLLGLASWRVARSWQTRPAHGRRLKWLEWRGRLAHGGAETRLRLRRRLLNINPVLWLQSRGRVIRGALFLFTLALAAGCFALNFVRAFHWSELVPAMVCSALLHFLVLTLIAFEAGSRLVETRRDGAAELVLSTALTTHDILRGHRLALWRLFGPVLFVVLAYDVLWLVFATRHAPKPNDLSLAAMFAGSMAVVFLLNASSLVWCGLFHGLHARRTSQAGLRAFMKVIVLPFLWLELVELSGPPEISSHARLVIFTGLTIVNAWLFQSVARRDAHEQFRAALAQGRRTS